MSCAPFLVGLLIVVCCVAAVAAYVLMSLGVPKALAAWIVGAALASLWLALCLTVRVVSWARGRGRDL